MTITRRWSDGASAPLFTLTSSSDRLIFLPSAHMIYRVLGDMVRGPPDGFVGVLVREDTAADDHVVAQIC